MNSQNQAQFKELSEEELNDFIVECIEDIKGKKIIKLDLRELEERPTNFFIVCEGDSTTQVKAIADNINRRLKTEMGERPFHFEGQQGSRWVLLDYSTTVVHVFYNETRAFYSLEDLWGDAVSTEYDSL